MALLTEYGAFNRVVDTDLMIRFTATRVKGDFVFNGGVSSETYHHAWEYHRIATKSYRYVGMDRETARACAEAMQTYYVRSHKASEWNSETGVFATVDGGLYCTASIAVQHVAGCMYEVAVSVSEDDSRMTLTAQSPGTLFTHESAWQYDDEDEED